jgi:hypothetical protein
MSKPSKAKSPEEQRAERERYVVRKTLEGKYKQRFTIAKEGKTALNRRDYRMMIYRYSEYLKIMADTFEVQTIYDLKPAFFDAKKDVAELLLISQIYWELAKVYDGSSKSKDKLELCLKQFIRFTIGMQFQGLNTEIIRKELKRRKFKNKELMLKCLEGIYKESGGCYVATYFETDLQTLQILRNFKMSYLNKSPWGKQFIFYYYELSPELIYYFNRYSLLKIVLQIPIQIFIKGLAFILGIMGYKS